MKKLFFVFTFVLIAGLARINAQVVPPTVVHPIPSFNYAMNESSAYFHETKGINNNREKRDMDVVVNTRSTIGIPSFAMVFVFKLSPMKILGPYFVLPGQQLTVPIDNARWGVLVSANFEADVSVWAD